MFCVKLPSAVPLLVLSCLYLISLGCGGLPPGDLPLSAQQNGSAGAVSVSISPQKAALQAGNSLQFTAASYGLLVNRVQPPQSSRKKAIRCSSQWRRMDCLLLLLISNGW